MVYDVLFMNSYKCRIFLLFSLSIDYSDNRVVDRINSDLANTIGNLLARCTAPAVNLKQEFPSLEENFDQFLDSNELEMYASLHSLPGA